MEAERLIKGYEHEKHQERKRKGAHLEAIFKQAAKKSNQDNNNKDSSRLLNNYSGDEKLVSIRSPEIPPCNTTFEKAATSSRNSLGNNGNDVENVVSSFRDGGNHLGKPRHSPGENGSPSGNSVNPLRNTKNGIVSNGSAKVHVRSLSENKSHDVAYQKDRNSSCASRESEQERSDRTAEENSQGSHYTGFKQIEESSESTGSEFPTSVSIKQEKIDEPPPVQVISTQSQEEGRKSLVQDNGEIGEDCLKFLLFSGKLYRCEKISDLTHGFSRFIGDSVLGRKGNIDPRISGIPVISCIYISHETTNIFLCMLGKGKGGGVPIPHISFKASPKVEDTCSFCITSYSLSWNDFGHSMVCCTLQYLV